MIQITLYRPYIAYPSDKDRCSRRQDREDSCRYRIHIHRQRQNALRDNDDCSVLAVPVSWMGPVHRREPWLGVGSSSHSWGPLRVACAGKVDGEDRIRTPVVEDAGVSAGHTPPSMRHP